MKILCWHVRGINGSSKRCRVNQVIFGANLDWVGLQETKLHDVSDPIIGEIFWCQNFTFSFSLAVDSPRGLIYCWNYVFFIESSRLCHPKFLAIKCSWATEGGLERIICLCSLTILSERVVSFETITAFLQNWESNDFIIFEDFNSVMYEDERWGVNGFGSALEGLLNFVHSLDLHDMPF